MARVEIEAAVLPVDLQLNLDFCGDSFQPERESAVGWLKCSNLILRNGRLNKIRPGCVKRHTLCDLVMHLTLSTTCAGRDNCKATSLRRTAHFFGGDGLL